MGLPWKNLTSLADVDTLKQESFNTPVVIYKHSTRCATSSFVKESLEKDYVPIQNEVYYYLDLIEYRDISNAIAENFEVIHQSPQIIILNNGKATYNTSHMAIAFSEIEKQIAPTSQA